MNSTPLDATTDSRPKRSAGPARWFRDLGVRPKVLAAVGLNAMVAIAVGVMGLSSLSSSADQADTLYSSNVMGVSALDDIRGDVADIRLQGRSAVLAPDEAAKDDAVANLETAYNAFHED